MLEATVYLILKVRNESYSKTNTRSRNRICSIMPEKVLSIDNMVKKNTRSRNRISSIMPKKVSVNDQAWFYS